MSFFTSEVKTEEIPVQKRLRDIVACKLCNFILNHIATEEYCRDIDRLVDRGLTS